MTTPKSAQNPRQQFENLSRYYLGAHTRWLSLKKYIGELETRIAATFAIDASGGDGHVDNATSGVVQIVRLPDLSELTRARLLLSLVEASEDLATARKLVEPVLQAVAELEAEEEAERVAEGERQAALRDALEAAKEKALAAAEKDPEVVKARKALEAAA